MKLTIFILTLTLLFSCEKPSYSISDKERLSNEVTRKAAIKLRKEADLYPCGSGGQAMDQIKMLALAFNYYKPIKIEDGRKLLILSANQFVKEINDEKRIHQFLNNSPFKPSNVEIRIFLSHPDGSEPLPEELQVISIIDGILTYKVGVPETNLLKTIYRETYEEALQKIENSTVQFNQAPPDEFRAATEA